MGMRVYIAAIGMFLASLLARRESRKRAAAFLVVGLLLAFSLPGCASVDVVMLSSETFIPQVSQVEILEREPARPYVQIAILSVDSMWLSIDSKREKILEKAATLGADAVVFDLHLRPSNYNRTAGQHTPPTSVPPPDVHKPVPDGLRSAAQDNLLDTDVRIVLVGGRGRGGGQGYGGYWRGRGGWGPSRPWGRFYGPYYYGPRPWGYGFYGPGWWGYGPYWGGFSPYGGYGPYWYGASPGYGYMNTVTIGTAIRYTD